MPDYQLSLAIGKEGQNARLAAKLTNWKIDIKSETQYDEEFNSPDDELESEIEDNDTDTEIHEIIENDDPIEE